jgi:hypothetical protein
LHIPKDESPLDFIIQNPSFLDPSSLYFESLGDDGYMKDLHQRFLTHEIKLKAYASYSNARSTLQSELKK